MALLELGLDQLRDFEIGGFHGVDVFCIGVLSFVDKSVAAGFVVL
ncbi:hypothetical protein VDG1235_4157 [Verrucomicrobiia bacterium DG1235]|nr:hypothetical protein VDG1235_4157 [Verrucomicrobiae bacterium DG1235]